MHDVQCLELCQCASAFDQAAQIAVCEDTDGVVLTVYDGSGTQPFGADLSHGFAERGIGWDARCLLKWTHHVADQGEQTSAQGATRMGAGEIFGFEAACVEQGDGQCIAHGHLCGGAGGRGQVVGAGLFFDAGVEHDGRVSAQTGLGAARHGNEGNAHALDERQDGVEFFAFAAVADRHDDVLGGDHAQIAMTGFCGMDEHGWRACGGECGCDFAADMPAFAHACNNNAASALEDALDGLHEGGFESS